MDRVFIISIIRECLATCTGAVCIVVGSVHCVCLSHLYSSLQVTYSACLCHVSRLLCLIIIATRWLKYLIMIRHQWPASIVIIIILIILIIILYFSVNNKALFQAQLIMLCRAMFPVRYNASKHKIVEFLTAITTLFRHLSTHCLKPYFSRHNTVKLL